MDFYFANSLRHLGEALKRLSGKQDNGAMYLPNASPSFSETDKKYVIRCIKDAIEIIEYSVDENAKAVASDSAKDKKRRPPSSAKCWRRPRKESRTSAATLTSLGWTATVASAPQMRSELFASTPALT